MDGLAEILDHHGKRGERAEAMFRLLIKNLNRESGALRETLLLFLNLYLVDAPDRFHVKGRHLSELSPEERCLVRKAVREALNLN